MDLLASGVLGKPGHLLGGRVDDGEGGCASNKLVVDQHEVVGRRHGCLGS